MRRIASRIILITAVAACADKQPPEHIDTAKPIVRVPTGATISAGQDDAGRDGMHFVGRPDSSFVVAPTGLDFRVNMDRLTLWRVSAGGRNEMWLVKADSQATPTPWTVVASLIIPDTLSDSVRVWTQWCSNRGSQEISMIALVNYDHVPEMTRIRRAWKLDLVGRRFDTVAAGGVTCRNTQAVDDSALGEAVRRTNAARDARIEAARIAAAQRDEDDKARANEAADAERLTAPVPILREPVELPQLPASARGELSRRKCRVPGFSGGSDRPNVFRGNFLGTGVDTWAVWCMTDDSSTILVFRDGVAAPIAQTSVELVSFPRHPVFQREKTMGSHYGCIGRLHPTATSRDYLNESFADLRLTLSAEERAAAPHDGIEDATCEGVSQIIYWTGRRWVRLPGGH